MSREQFGKRTPCHYQWGEKEEARTETHQERVHQGLIARRATVEIVANFTLVRAAHSCGHFALRRIELVPHFMELSTLYKWEIRHSVW